MLVSAACAFLATNKKRFKGPNGCLDDCMSSVLCVNLINKVIFQNKLHTFLPASIHSSINILKERVSHLAEIH